MKITITKCMSRICNRCCFTYMNMDTYNDSEAINTTNAVHPVNG